MTLRDLWFGVVAVVCAALVGAVAHAEYSKYVVERVDSSDWADLRDEDVTGDDPATVAALTTITALQPSRAEWVGCSVRFAGSTDSAIVQPIFYSGTSTVERIGDAVTLTATAIDDGDTQYVSPSEWWEANGASRCKFRITTISGTMKEVWGGTR